MISNDVSAVKAVCLIVNGAKVLLSAASAIPLNPSPSMYTIPTRDLMALSPNARDIAEPCTYSGVFFH